MDPVGGEQFNVGQAAQWTPPKGCITPAAGLQVSGPLLVLFEQIDAAVSTGYHDDFYLPIHAALENSITQNAQLLEAVNRPFVTVFGRDLIGNGVDGFAGTNTSILGDTGLFGDLGDGGYLFGDGGVGAAGVAGVDSGVGEVGGAAGLFGNGVAGSAGGGAGGGSSDGAGGGGGGAPGLPGGADGASRTLSPTGAAAAAAGATWA